MIAPQNPTPVPNAVFTPNINLAVSIANGAPVVRTVQLTFQAAAVSAGPTIIRNAACEPHVQDLAHMLNAMGARITGIGTNRISRPTPA